MKLWVGGGILAGLLSLGSPGTLFVGLLVLALSLLIRKYAPAGDKRFLTYLFLAGFLLRVLVSLGLDAGSWMAGGGWPAVRGPVRGWDLNAQDNTRSYLKLGDSDSFSARAYALSEYVRGKREVVLYLRVKNPRPHGYLYPMAFYYYLFGFAPVSVKFINCLIGALLGPLLFWIGKQVFHPQVGRWAGVGAAFLPSLVLWSATNLKDPSFITLTALLFLLAVKIQQSTTLKQGAGYTALFCLALLLHMTLRSDAGFSLALAACVFFAWVLKRIRRESIPLWVRVLLAGLLIWAAVHFWPQIYGKLTFAFYRHWGNVDAVSTAYTQTYRYLPAPFYTGDPLLESVKLQGNLPVLAKTILRAVTHYLLEPFPSRMGNFSFLMVYPQMILWYALLPCALVGIAWSLRRNFSESGALILTLLVWVVIGALASGNVGLVFRVRDMVTPFFLLFASAGVWLWRREATPS